MSEDRLKRHVNPPALATEKDDEAKTPYEVMTQTQTIRANMWVMDALKIAITTIVSVTSAVWCARGMLDATNSRVTVVEGKVSRLELDIVPRSEHNAHWDALRDTMNDVKAGMVEVRKRVDDIAVKVNK